MSQPFGRCVTSPSLRLFRLECATLCATLPQFSTLHPQTYAKHPSEAPSDPLMKSGVAVEKLLPAKFAKMKLRRDAPQSIFSDRLDIFYPQILVL
jgi:hypothetical protein